MVVGHRVGGVTESSEQRERKRWLVAARWLRSSTKPATWEMSFIYKPGAHRPPSTTKYIHKHSNTTLTQTLIQICAYTQQGWVPNTWRIIVDCVLLWPWWKIHSQADYRKFFAEKRKKKNNTGHHFNNIRFIEGIYWITDLLFLVCNL